MAFFQLKACLDSERALESQNCKQPCKTNRKSYSSCFLQNCLESFKGRMLKGMSFSAELTVINEHAVLLAQSVGLYVGGESVLHEAHADVFTARSCEHPLAVEPGCVARRVTRRRDSLHVSRHIKAATARCWGCKSRSFIRVEFSFLH